MQNTDDPRIVAISNESAAVELNIEEAVAQGTNALDRMRLVQSLVAPIQGAADTSATVIHNIRSTSDTWGPFLPKIKLFSEIVDVIAQVRDLSRITLRSSITTRSDL
jgi:hypothetical protein